MGLGIYLPGTGTLKTSFAFAGNAGEYSSTVSCDLWNSKGSAGAVLNDIAIAIKAKLAASSTYSFFGLPPLDNHWVECRVTGGTNPGNDPAYEPFTCTWFPLGTDATLKVPGLPGNCSYALEFRSRPPLDDASGNYDIDILGIPGNVSHGAAPGVSMQAQGIVSGLGDATAYEFIDAPTLAATGTPDDYTHLGTARYLLAGLDYRLIAADAHQHNQNDSAAAALTSGQAYYVTVSAGASGATYTKGLKATAASAVAPAPPTDELMVGTVKVRYSAGTTEILDSDITLFAQHGQFRCDFSVYDLILRVAPGRAILPGATIDRRSGQNVTLPVSTTTWAFIGEGGGVVTSATATPPRRGLTPLCSAVTSGASITSISDLRKILEPNLTLGNASRQITLTPAANVVLDCSGGRRFFKITPDQDMGITFTGLKTGQEVFLVVLTSGTTSYTFTFGIGVITEETTRTTGTADGKWFCWRFVGTPEGYALQAAPYPGPMTRLT